MVLRAPGARGRARPPASTVEAGAGSGRLRVPAWSLERRAGDGTPVGRALAAILARLARPATSTSRLEARHPVARRPRQLGGHGGRGRARAPAPRRRLARTTASRAAVDGAEAVFHGTPSGIDAAAAFGGDVGRFTPRRGLAAGRRCCRRMHDLRRPHRPAARHGRAGRGGRRACASARQPWGRCWSSSASWWRRASARWRSATSTASGGCSTWRTACCAACASRRRRSRRLVHGARAAGAIGAKLTGAGGGGAVIALAPGHEDDVLARWRRDGFDGFVAAVGPPLPAAATTSPRRRRAASDVVSSPRARARARRSPAPTSRW